MQMSKWLIVILHEYDCVSVHTTAARASIILIRSSTDTLSFLCSWSAQDTGEWARAAIATESEKHKDRNNVQPTASPTTVQEHAGDVKTATITTSNLSLHLPPRRHGNLTL